MPLEIVGLGSDQVRFVWSEEEEDVWGARDLRLRCSCALCKSEVTGERILADTAVPAKVSVTHMNLVGNYGLNIHFSDGHTTGIYRFSELYETRRKR
jgi:ATP-binding protein involved in chromosome partitioning